MAEYFVERQCWTHWPKVLVMCRKHGDGIERRRYVPDRGTCRNTQTDFDFMCSECGKCVDNGRVLGFNFCPRCGREVVE